MSKKSLKLWVVLLLPIAIMIGVRTRSPNTLKVPFYGSAECTRQWFTTTELAHAKIRHVVPEFSMVDQNGDSVSRNTTQGKIHVADFFFTRCSGICPALSHQFKLLQDSLTKDSKVLLLS